MTDRIDTWIPLFLAIVWIADFLRLRRISSGWPDRYRATPILLTIIMCGWMIFSPTFCQNVKCKGHDGLDPKPLLTPEGR